VQILENKLLSPDENLFLRGLRSNLTADEVTKMAEAYKKLKSYEAKNVYLDRLIQANREAFKEMLVNKVYNPFVRNAGESSAFLLTA